MDNHNYDSYCGVYCGACDIMMSHKTGKKYKLASFWNEARVKSWQKAIGVKYDDSTPFTHECRGCKSDMVFSNCKICKIRECARAKKKDHCIDCGEYPCTLINAMQQSAGLLPHIKTNHGSMERIKSTGVDQWLSEQEKKWQCPECHTGFAWYSTKCDTCGKDLKAYSYRFNWLQSLLLKIGIYLLTKKTGK